MSDLTEANELMRERTGIVIPVYLPGGVERGRGEALLRETLRSCCSAVSDPAAVCVSVGGESCGGDVGRHVAEECGATVQASPRNKGKFQAVREGMRRLLAGRPYEYFAVIDQDGDHFLNELPAFLRAAAHIERTAGTRRLMILGSRRSRHRPMGFPRGEFEELADRVLLDALAYHAATSRRPLRLEYATLYEEFPDFHSGYKVFSRSTAEDVFLSEPEMAGCSEVCYYRHAAEAVMSVEALVRGAVMGVVSRSTLNEQPISTFGLLERCGLAADKIIWPCKRLGVPAAFVRQWLANHIPRLLLGTLVPAGRDEIENVRRLVLDAYRTGVEPGEELRRPLFV